MDNNIVLDIKEFNPKEAELTALAQSCTAIDLTDLEAVKAKRLELKKARVEITTYGKVLREGATKFAKDVIAREKELVAIIEPEEEKLQTIEAEVKLAKEREERKALLPQRIERLKTALDWKEGQSVGVSEDELLDMDGSQFEGLLNRMLAEKNEADRAEIARQQAEIDRQREEQRKEQERLDWEAKASERAEQARKEERERMEQEQRDKEAREKAEAERKEREEREQRERNEREEAMRIEREKKEEEDRKAKLEADQRYQQWLIDIDYVGLGLELDESTEGYVVAYQVVATFKK